MSQRKSDFIDFLNAQMEEIKRYRSQQCRKSGRNLGQVPVMEWIRMNAASFRQDWQTQRAREHA